MSNINNYLIYYHRDNATLISKYKNIPNYYDNTNMELIQYDFISFRKKIITYNHTIKKDNINLVHSGITIYFVETKNCIKIVFS